MIKAEDLRNSIRSVVENHLELSQNHTDGSYLYQLTRVKSGFSVGTVTIDDFQEISLDFSSDIVDDIVKAIEKELQLRQNYSPLI